MAQNPIASASRISPSAHHGTPASVPLGAAAAAAAGAAATAALEHLGLTQRQDQIAGTLSGGWKQRLALGACTLPSPELLPLDEPTAGVDSKARREFWNEIHALAAEGLTVLVSTHYMDEAEHCNRVGFMYRGQLLAFDTPRALKTAYLNGSAWDLAAYPLLEAVERLEQLPGIAQASLHGDRAHVILRPGAWTPESLTMKLGESGIEVQSIEAVESSLEDVFTLLAHQGMEAEL